jgi:hypothetical protein
MATKRRGGFGPPELRGTLGTLLRTTTGVVRDALERGAREGRARLDDVRSNRRRQDALAELGELVLDLIRRGEIDLAELPEARDLVRQLDQFDAEANGEPEPEPPRSLHRSRFDDRSPRDDRAMREDRVPRDHGAPQNGATHSHRAPHDDRAQREDRVPRESSATDGTVSSGATPRPGRPTTPARPQHVEATFSSPSSAPSAAPSSTPSMAPSTRTPTKPIRNNWRPPVDDDVPTLADMPAAKRTTPLPHSPQRKGGISFEDDDLGEYMHPDDVPPKGPPKNPGDGSA